MHILSVVSAVLALALAVFWAGVGAGGVLGRLKRNRWFGVRADETMKSETAFALGNKVAGPGFLFAALIMAIGGVLGFTGDWGFAFALGAVVAGLAVAAIAAGVGVKVAATVPDEPAAGGCSSGCCSGGDAEAAAESCDDGPASDCGTSSCGSCALQGMCTSDDAPATGDAVR